jgi:ATP-dependent Lon protease
MTDKPIDLPAALRELPIFPLPQVVLFPRALLPLHIFEPRYRAMLADALASHRVIAMALVDPSGAMDDAGQPRIASIAGVGAIMEHQALPDGRSNILLHGQTRVTLEELPFVPPYRRARATLLEEIATPVSDGDRASLFAAATAFVAELAKRDPKVRFQLPRNLPPGAVADMCAHHLVIDARARQAVLEELDVAARVRRVIEELAAQHMELSREAGGGALN